MQAHLACLAPAILRSLGLDDSQLQSLRRQGYITTERRGRDARVCRLRFRYHRRQRVIYLGAPGARVDAIRAALAAWHRSRRSELQLARLHREAGQQLRAVRQRLAVPLAERGYWLHGHTIRRIRQGRRAASASHKR